ncbi:MAG: nicotinate-nucleotide--dimethylbenzimidazole phosphoribosyltransferase [Acidobacteriota bacterium]
MTLLAETLSRITVPSTEVALRAQKLLDGKTKPRRSLGVLEDLAVKVASIRVMDVPPIPKKAIVVMAGDHGVTAEGVSAYPQEVTAQMVLNFAHGGAAINVLARHAGAEVRVVDMGVKAPVPDLPGVRSARVGPGTRNLAEGPAMSREEAVRALEEGIAVAREAIGAGVDLIGIGEMGIGNTTSASALTAVLAGASPAETTGRGTGIDDAAYRRKIDVVERAISSNRPNAKDAIEVLAKLGGFEIAGLAGVVLGAAANAVPVVIDGFISSAAALVAARIEPKAEGYLIPSHASVEVGHRIVLAALGLRPLMSLDMRLGEGTGAALAMMLVDAAIKVMHEMATFDSAGVTDTGR